MKHQRRLYTSLAFVLVAALLGVLSLATLGAQQPPHDSRTHGALPPEKIAPAPEVKATGRVLRADKFDKLDQSWKNQDHAPMPDQAGKWEAAAGKLIQNKTQGFGDNLAETSFLADVDTAGKSTVAVQVYPQGNQFAGLIFRASDRGYYVFTVYRGDTTVPVRRTLLRFDPQRGYTTLAEDSTGAGLALDRWQELRVELDGNRIQAYFDGQAVFDVRDGSLTRGSAGVTTLALGEMAFDNFTVAQP